MNEEEMQENDETLELAEAETFAPGFHVMHGDNSLGCYPTRADAEAYANGHPRNEGLDVSIVEIK